MNFLEIVKAFEKNGFEAYFEKTVADGLKKCLSLIPQGSVVGWGGSMSCVDSGLIKSVKESFTIIDRDTAKDSQERNALLRKILAEADVFLTSFNAVTEDGKALNIDGSGNRVAAISFGPKSVIALVGKNKIVKDEDQAYERASTVAAGKNAVRFGKKYEEGDSLCNMVQILRRGGNGRIKIVFVDEELGY